ncbi:MAG: hypothetical protein COB02_04435 [Candidatus Cloacimonadota bacterium]|nr:MAG: hypothetical protein COB02_04435 [Candidatus Cloacimonadota bacterium]
MYYLKNIICFVLLVSSLFSEGLRVEISSIDIKDFPDLEMQFRIVDRTGKVVSKLERKNIRLYENGTKIENYFMQISKDPSEIVLVVDDSGSMHNYLKPLIKGIRKFIRLLKPNDLCTIVAFSDTVRVLSGPTSDKKKLLKSLRNLNGYGATSLYDAIYKAAEILPEFEKTAIVLLSDGVDQNKRNTGRISNYSAIDAVTKAVHKNIPIYTIGLGRLINRQELKDFSRLSNGSFYYAPSINQLTDLYQLIARNLKSDVKIKYASPNLHKDGKYRNLELEVFFETLSGRNNANYFSPGVFKLFTTGFGYNSKESQNSRDSMIKFRLIDEGNMEQSGAKDFMQTFIQHLGK